MRIAVLGATGSVGRLILQLLDARLFPLRDVVALGSQNSVGGRFRWGIPRCLLLVLRLLIFRL
jgi:aspartate-semialdehyde dehydrogenase